MTKFLLHLATYGGLLCLGTGISLLAHLYLPAWLTFVFIIIAFGLNNWRYDND